MRSKTLDNLAFRNRSLYKHNERSSVSWDGRWACLDFGNTHFWRVEAAS